MSLRFLSTSSRQEKHRKAELKTVRGYTQATFHPKQFINHAKYSFISMSIGSLIVEQLVTLRVFSLLDSSLPTAVRNSHQNGRAAACGKKF